MLDRETKSKLEKLIDKINEEDVRALDVKIAFDEHFIYLQFEVFSEGTQHVLQISDFINGNYSAGSVYTEISDAILKIINREYSIKLARVFHDR